MIELRRKASTTDAIKNGSKPFFFLMPSREQVHKLIIKATAFKKLEDIPH